jgi:hypothetical protein
MKITATLGLVLALAVAVRAQETPAASPQPPPAPAARPSSLLPGLPTYAPPPPTPKALDQPSTDSDVLVLPKMTVKQKPRPRLNADIVYEQKNLGQLLAKQKYTQLDQALNKFTLPLFGQSIAERALEEHRREKKQALTEDVLNLSNAIKSTDPEEAKALEKAITMP